MHPKLSLSGILWVACLASAVLITSCRDDASTGPDKFEPTDSINAGIKDSLPAAMPLFQGETALLDGVKWPLESGAAKSAKGKLNPELFLEGKNPFMIKGARLKLNLFENATFVAVIDSSRLLGPGRVTALGHVEGMEGTSFVATCEAASISALVTVPDLGVFRVEFAGGTDYRVIEQNGFVPACPPTPVPDVKTDSAAAPAPLRKVSAGPETIDIAVVYTAAALAGAKSLAAMNTLADAAVAQANLAYKNSGVALTLNLIYRGQVTYTESGSIETDLTRLQSANDAFLAEVHTLRNTYGADIVTLITETGGATYAGLGYVMGAVNPAYGAYAFNVVRRAYASGYSVLAHEVGHNMGCMHDRANSANAGAFDYSYGHRWIGTDGLEYHDLMAYPPGILINQFSNPAYSYKGKPTGVAGSANTAITLNNTIPTVAAYRVRVPPTVELTSPTAGDTLSAPSNVILNAVTGGSAAITKVEFYNGSSLLGTDILAPFSFSWNPVTAGTYTVSAKVYTKTGTEATSAPVTFTTGTTFIYGTMTDVFVGTTGVTGGVRVVTSLDDPVFTVKGTGPGPALKADNFQFLRFEPITGDVRLEGKVVSLEGPDPGALAGIMIRETLTAGSKFMFIGRNKAGELLILKRLTLNGAVVVVKPVSTKLPVKMELIRKGSDIAAYRSDDGRNWTFVAAQAIAMTPVVHLGAAVSSNTLSTAATAVIRGLEYEDGRSPQNNPSIVTLSTPVSGSSFNAGTTLAFPAVATDRDGPKNILRVEFFNDTAFSPEPDSPKKLGQDLVAPYTFSWKATAGIAHIKARVEDTSHHDGYSNELVLDIKGPGFWVANPVADSYFRDGKYDSLNYGAAATTLVRSSSTLGESMESALKFRIDSLATIAHATLRLYGNILAGTEPVPVSILPVDSTGWLETGKTGINWRNKPAGGNLIASGTVTGFDLKWYEFDVSEYVKSRKAAGSVLVAFRVQGVNPTISYASFASRNAKSGFPELILSNR